MCKGPGVEKNGVCQVNGKKVGVGGVQGTKAEGMGWRAGSGQITGARGN